MNRPWWKLKVPVQARHAAEQTVRHLKRTRQLLISKLEQTRLRLLTLASRVEKLEHQLEEVRTVISERGPAPWDSGVDESAWEAAKADEADWWRGYLRSGGLFWPNDYTGRLDPDLPLQQYVKEHLNAPPDSTVTILDVGAGPLTSLGKRWDERTIEIIAVDPLADRYRRLLSESGITPLVEVHPGEAESLTSMFPLNHFDVVHMRNALDHSRDPLLGIRQMLQVTKPGGCVLLLHYSDEAQNAGYLGFHNWNLRAKDGGLLLWNRRARVRVDHVFADEAEVTVEQIINEGGRDWVLACLRKRDSSEW